MYFEKFGKSNTEETIKLAYKRGEALGLNEVVVASTTGDTANKVLEVFKGYQVTVVTYHCGFKEPFKNVMQPEVLTELQNKGAHVVIATHALSGIERSIVKKHGGVYPVLIIADTLKLFGQGLKVTVEISVMAADSGNLTGNDIVAIGGSGRGADTATILTPVNQSDFFNLRIREIICKPRTF